MITRFKRDRGRASPSLITGSAQGMYFRVCFPLAVVVALADDASCGVQDDTADRRVRTGGAQPEPG